MGEFATLLQQLKTYLDDAQIASIEEAYELAAQSHAGQHRISGDPYISHPVAVALILANMHMDHQSIMAALMHDVLEDTGVTKSILVKTFGENIANLVDGVSKLTQIEFETYAEQQAENFRKMVLAMVRDIRVILVKLADRLHNMRTIDVLSRSRQRRIARETLDIYAPIANRLGMHDFRIELEDLGFSALYPLRYRILKEAVRKARGHRKEVIDDLQSALEGCLKGDAFQNAAIIGREKHLFSLYKKMRNKRMSFAEIMDMYGFRVLVDTVDQCYRVLGAVHNLYKPVPDRFKDYIAIPKSNGYQSLHTTLFGPYGVPIEIQIRTHEMHHMASNGIAAHWLYKNSEVPGTEAQARAREWLKSLLEMQQNAGNSLEFIENVKVDLFPDEVYVFTPKGEIFKLTNGATCIDFAYAIHTDIGNTCVAAKIDRHLVPLSSKLKNGQTVEIVSTSGARPNPAWLDFVVTGKARGNIRHFLKSQQRTELIVLGKRLLQTACTVHQLDLNILQTDHLQKLLIESGLEHVDQLYEEIGLGNQMSAIVAKRLLSIVKPETFKRTTEAVPPEPLLIKGSEGMVVTFAKCCHPIPGDPIVAFLSAGRGLVIHTDQCKNITQFRDQTDKCVRVQWSDDSDREYQVGIRLEVVNRRGVLAMLARTIADAGANIDNINIEQKDGRYSTVDLTLAVGGRQHLARTMRRLRRIKIVTRLSRLK